MAPSQNRLIYGESIRLKARLQGTQPISLSSCLPVSLSIGSHPRVHALAVGAGDLAEGVNDILDILIGEAGAHRK